METPNQKPKQIIDVKALIDSRAQGEFVSPEWVKREGLKPLPLPLPIKVFNVDGTINKGHAITHYIDMPLIIEGYSFWEYFMIIDLGGEDMILRWHWLNK